MLAELQSALNEQTSTSKVITVERVLCFKNYIDLVAIKSFSTSDAMIENTLNIFVLFLKCVANFYVPKAFIHLRHLLNFFKHY